MVAPTLTILILTEDSSKKSHATWTALLRRMCRLVEPSCMTQVLEFKEPAPQLRATMAGNSWASRKPANHKDRVEFWRTIADSLVAANIVIFHVDGDTAWSKRHTSTNVDHVRTIALVRLRDALEQRRPGNSENTAVLAAFIPIHPFYAVEAWLFHNYDRLAEYCRDRGQSPPRIIDEWRAEPTLLDEQLQPDQQIPFGKAYNLELAEALNNDAALALYERRTSFYEAVEALRDCPQLRQGLLRTSST